MQTIPIISKEVEFALLQGVSPCSSYKLTLSQRTLLLEMTYNNKKVIVSVIYRPPSQNNREFDLFLSNFERHLSDINKHKPFLSVITGDLNARYSSERSKDMDTIEGSKLFSITSSNCFPQ